VRPDENSRTFHVSRFTFRITGSTFAPVSIVTKTGDGGATGLMYNWRVSKVDPRVEACGSVDELNAALGLARATAEHEFIREHLLAIQKALVILMGELATRVEDLPRYVKDGYTLVTAELTAKLEKLVRDIEAQNITYSGWATPGASVNSAALDVARVTCRRAERRVCALREAGHLQNTEISVYLNRLSDVLWLFARWVETKPPQGP
jgi:cob(I)alamin adenosyltransferase